MGVDPVSMVVAALVVAALVKRVPALVAEFVEAANQDDGSEATRAREQKLRDGGFEPATARGVLGRIVGNVWREAWQDLDKKRQAARGRRHAAARVRNVPGGPSWLDRLADKLDAKVTDTTSSWRTHPGGGGDPKPAGPDAGTRWIPPGDGGPVSWPNDPPDSPARDDGRGPTSPGPRQAPPSPGPPVAPDRQPVSPDEDMGTPINDPESVEAIRGLAAEGLAADQPLTFPADTTGTRHRPPAPPRWTDARDGGRAYRETQVNFPFVPHPPTGTGEGSPGHSDAATDRGPIVGTLERTPQSDPSSTKAIGKPADPPVIEGEVVSSPVRAGSVTGVISGAAEARAIQKAVTAANDAYIQAMGNIRTRIIRLGEQTLSQVQMAQRSHVVTLTIQAAEAAASAQADARRCGNEVGPVLGQVARAFERLNS